MYDLLMWALVVGLVLFNAFFVAAEFALVKVRVSRLIPRAKRGSRAAAAAVRMTEHLDAYLSATQLGITLASLGLGWIGEAYLNELIQRGFGALQLHVSSIVSHAISATIALGLITALHLVWGELAPKNLAIGASERVSLLVALPLRAFYIVFWPFIASLNALANLSLRVVGMEPISELELSLSQEELRLAFAHAHSSGQLTAQERALMENVLLFAHMRARQVMLPRTRIVHVSTLDGLEANVEKVIRSGHTRVPVVKEDLDQVLGYVHVKDVARLALEPRPWKHKLEDFLRPISFLSEHISLSLLLVHFQRQRSHIVVLVDEYGGTAGMVTLENVLEQLVGAIRDEFDVEQPLIQRVSRNCFRIDGRVPLTIVANRCKVEFPPTEADTIGGFVTERLGYIPRPGQRVETDGFQIVVTGAEAKRITSVELVLQPGAQDPA